MIQEGCIRNGLVVCILDKGIVKESCDKKVVV